MRALGRLTAVFILAGLAAGAVVGVRSMPDIKRYLKMRQM